MVRVQPELVVPGVHLLAFPIGQVYIWDWGGGVTVIDSGVVGSAPAIVAAVEALGRRASDVREIVLTHYHDDHRGGAAELRERTGGQVIAHRLDAPVIRGEVAQTPPRLTDDERPIAEDVLTRIGAAPPRPATDGPADLATLARGLVASALPPFAVDREVEDGDCLDGGGLVVHVPGHTAGSIALLAPSAGVVFTGDTVASYAGVVIAGVFNVDRKQLGQSIRRLAQLGADTACFGHGEPVVGDARRRLQELADALR